MAFIGATYNLPGIILQKIKEGYMGTVIVIGGNRGIGIGFVNAYLQDGYAVIATYRDETRLCVETLLDSSNHVSLNGLKEKYPDRLKLYKLDIVDEEAVSEFAQTVEKVDILVLNAGVKGYSVPGTKPHEHTTQELMTALSVNTVAIDRIMRLFFPLLLNNANSCAICTGSLVGRTADNGSGGSHVYRISKAATHALIWNWSINLMNEWHLKNGGDSEKLIKTPCAVTICPGWVRTDMGGPSARLSISESVAGMKTCVSEVRKTKRSNGLYMYTGEIAEAYSVPKVLADIFLLQQASSLYT